MIAYLFANVNIFFQIHKKNLKKCKKNLDLRCIFANLFFLANIYAFFLGVMDRKYYLCERNKKTKTETQTRNETFNYLSTPNY